MKKILAITLALIMVLSLCACGKPSTTTTTGGGTGTSTNSGTTTKKPDEKSMLGTYKLYAMQYDEDHAVVADDLFEGESYITLKSGGDAEMCIEGDVNNVKWKMDGDKLVISASDGDMEGKFENGILTLGIDDTDLYFVGDGAEKTAEEEIQAVTLDEMLNEIAAGMTGDDPTAGYTQVQNEWNGWYYGCIDMSGCTDNWEFLNGATYDSVLYIELDATGNGKFAIYDPFGDLISNEHSNLYVHGGCHVEGDYLYADYGVAFNDDLNQADWRFVHNLAIPEKINVGSTSTEDNGATIGYDFQFKPWGDRWEDDPYTAFIPYFDAYIDAIDSGLESPFGDSFPGLGVIEQPNSGRTETVEPSNPGTTSEGLSPLLGSSPEKLDINNKGAVYVYYPGDQFEYNDDYGKLKNDDTGVGILIDPMLGSTNLAELKKSYEENNSDEEDYSLVETTINGHNAIIMKYSDWLGSTMRVDIDFGGNHDGFYGMSFAVSGDSLQDCDTDIVWAIINSMEIAK